MRENVIEYVGMASLDCKMLQGRSIWNVPTTWNVPATWNVSTFGDANND